MYLGRCQTRPGVEPNVIDNDDDDDDDDAWLIVSRDSR